MNLTQLFHATVHGRVLEVEEESEHWKALDRTGFYGKQGAGSLPFAKDTKRFLVAHRSRYVEEPGTWGTWGGAVNRGETPQQTALRELHEESDYSGAIHLMPLYVFRSGDFHYSNYLAVVDREFTPHPHQPYPLPGWETQGFRWCEFGHWPRPLHFGLRAVLNDPSSVATIQKVIAA